MNIIYMTRDAEEWRATAKNTIFSFI